MIWVRTILQQSLSLKRRKTESVVGHPIINILPKVSKIKIVDLFILFLKATVHGLTFGRVSSGP